MRLAAACLILCLGLPAHAAETVGWRGQGRGAFYQATPPSAWSPEGTVVWRTELPGPSNAAPVVVGNTVCTTIEPTGLLCADATTGAVRWQVTNEVVDALDADHAKAVRAQLAQVPGWEAELSQLQRDYAVARREARRGGDAITALEAITTRMEAVRASLDGVAPYRAVGSDPVIGWASATPVSDGTHIWAVFAQGVVACFTLDGTRVWTRWLGPRTTIMRGYTGQNTASPRLAGGHLIVGYDTLKGLDPKTGATRWDAGPFGDFGTPEVATIGGIDVVLTGDGRLVRARDGRVMQRDLGDLWYTGPLVHDDVVYYVGTTSAESSGASWPTKASALRLTASGDSVQATPLWSTELPSRHRYYATPVVWDDLLVTLTRDGEAVSLDRATGAIRSQFQVPFPTVAQTWTSPMVVGRHLVTMDDRGHLQVYAPGSTTPVRTARLESGLGPPYFREHRAWYRGKTALWHVTSRP